MNTLKSMDRQIAVDIMANCIENGHDVWDKAIEFLESEGYTVTELMRDDILSEYHWQYNRENY